MRSTLRPMAAAPDRLRARRRTAVRRGCFGRSRLPPEEQAADVVGRPSGPAPLPRVVGKDGVGTPGRGHAADLSASPSVPSCHMMGSADRSGHERLERHAQALHVLPARRPGRSEAAGGASIHFLLTTRSRRSPLAVRSRRESASLSCERCSSTARRSSAALRLALISRRSAGHRTQLGHVAAVRAHQRRQDLLFLAARSLRCRSAPTDRYRARGTGCARWPGRSRAGARPSRSMRASSSSSPQSCSTCSNRRIAVASTRAAWNSSMP